jgi:hypothetical protein
MSFRVQTLSLRHLVIIIPNVKHDFHDAFGEMMPLSSHLLQKIVRLW